MCLSKAEIVGHVCACSGRAGLSWCDTLEPSNICTDPFVGLPQNRLVTTIIDIPMSSEHVL